MKRFCLFVAALALVFGGVGQARAGLAGVSVNSTYYFPDTGSPFENDGTQTIPASFNAFGEVGESVTNTQIILTNIVGDDLSFTPASFNGPIFDFINSGSLISGVTIDGATNVPITASDITLTTDGAGGQLVEVNLQSLPFNTDFNVTLDVATSAVPEPCSIALLGTATVSLAGFFGWRRRQAAVATEAVG
jgi:hypothetical protein